MEKIRKCKYCGNETAVNIGMHNWKNLFRKPTLLEYTILFMLIMGLFTAWAYVQDIKACNEFYNESCIINQQLGLGIPFLNITNFTTTNFTFKEEILREEES